MTPLKSIFAAAAMLVLVSVSFAGPTSEIPERREFPVNPDVNPCQDFSKYVCSKVSESFKLREDRSHHTFSFSDSAERILEKKKQFFKSLAQSKPASDREAGLKNYYLACMSQPDRKKDEVQEVQRVQSILEKMKTREDFLNWIETSYLATESSPLEWGTISNQDNSLNNDLYIANEYLSLPEKSYYKRDDVVKDLENLLVEFFKTVKVKDPSGKAKLVLEFEKGLAEVTPTPEQFRQIVNNRNPIERAELVKRFPNLRLNKLLADVPEKVVIRNWVPEALAFDNKFFGEASLDSLKAIYLYNALKGYMDDAYPKFFQTKFDFEKKHFGGPNKRPDRQERCTRRVMRVFAKEIDAILMPRIFPNFPREKFIALAEKVRGSIIESLEENDWLSRDARKEAIAKMKSARLQLVSPETEKEWDFLPLASYTPNHPIENEKMVMKVMREKTLRELRELNDPGKWEMGPLTVNAYYDPSYNKFVMPIGILQYPFYDPQLPDEQNVAAVGTVIGHELGHGVDDQGARYDSKGRQTQWMSMADLKNFSERTQPLIAQFDAIGHNGRLTQGENIGDLVGVTAAYRVASKSKEFQSNLQLQKEFFLSYGRLWCNVARPKFEETQLKTDPHALGRARINEQIKHQPGFAKAFQCKDTDPMVLPKDKIVHIW